MSKRVVVALGGNALGKTNEEQVSLVKKTSKKIVDLIEEGYQVIVTHGNGPQVGMINLAMESNENNEIPFAECGAMSQGYIGYHLQQSIQNELDKKQIGKRCVTITTQVLVSEKDEAFNNPTKPIGSFYTKKEAEKISKEKGYIFKEDAGRGYRRVVPSPKPVEIIELDAINDLLNQGNVVIACGGGGIPVISKRGKLSGIDAVIDKDLSSSLLAEKLEADTLLILTNIDKVCINFNKPEEKKLSNLSIEEAEKYIENREFAEGSMLPKVNACLKFVKNTNKKAIITSLEKAKQALDGKTGTIISSSKEDLSMAEKKKTAKKKNFKFGISAFSIILILIILLGVLTHFLPTAQFVGEEIVNGTGVVKATLANILMSPIEGFADAIDVCIFVFILGGFLNIVAKTGALETGVKVLVQKLKGKELILIPILMFIFSIGGTTYGMLEETVGFYALLAATMVVAGMDTIVASAIVLLGAGCGVLGSTINPFATGAAVSAVTDKGIVVDQGALILIGIMLWLITLAISIAFVMIYAAKVKKNKGSTFLSLQEQKVMEKKYGKAKKKEEVAVLTGKQKVTLVLFGLAFLVLIFGFIPWSEGIVEKLSFTSILTGTALGQWWFFDAALWFLIIGIIIGIIDRQGEKGIVENFVSGAADMMSVILIIAVARGASYLMSVTYLDNYIIYNAADALKQMPVLLFTPLNYLLHIVLSVLVPSSSGLASLSAPIMGPLASQLSYSVEGTIMTFVAANGLVNLITPTCGAIMGGLALAGVEYTTWFKWSIKIIGCLALASILILMLAMLIF